VSVLYPYSVTVTRSSGTVTQTADGAVQGIVTVLAGAPASIQMKRDKGFGAPVGFQGGATNTSAPMPAWLIYLPLNSAVTALGQNGLRDGDSVADNGSSRTWKVDAAEYTPIGWQLACTPYSPDA